MLNIAWTARDGFLDLFPNLASRLSELDIKISSYFVCHHRLEEEYLELKYKLNNIWVMSTYLKQNWDSLNCSFENIRELENKYNTIPLIRCLWSDKFQLKLQEQTMIKNLVGHFNFWEEFLLRNKIDILISERPSILNTCVAWLVCKTLNIRFMSFINISALYERIAISASWQGYFDGLEESLKRKDINKKSKNYEMAVGYVKKMKQRPEKTIEAQINIERARKSTDLPLMEIKKLICEPSGVFRRNRLRKQYYISTSILKMFRNWVRVVINSHHYKLVGVFENSGNICTRHYFLYPLHRFGEWANYSFMGLSFADQLSVVKQVSNCLPLGRYLYVKEHTGGFGEKSVSFYRAIKKLSNVKLIHPCADTFELIRNCSGVITLGSTMGFEAIMLNKPALVLGDPWYKGLPGVYKAESPEMLARLLQQNDKLKVLSETEKTRVVYSLFDVSFDGVGPSKPKTLDHENLLKMVRGLYQKILEAQSESAYDAKST